VRTKELLYALYSYDSSATESLAVASLRLSLYILNIFFDMDLAHSYEHNYREPRLRAEYTTPPEHYIWAMETTNSLVDSAGFFFPLLEATTHVHLHGKRQEERLSKVGHHVVALVL
jgi:hypothetical protein